MQLVKWTHCQADKPSHTYTQHTKQCMTHTNTHINKAWLGQSSAAYLHAVYAHYFVAMDSSCQRPASHVRRHQHQSVLLGNCNTQSCDSCYLCIRDRMTSTTTNKKCAGICILHHWTVFTVEHKKVLLVTTGQKCLFRIIKWVRVILEVTLVQKHTDIEFQIRNSHIQRKLPW